MVPNLLVIGGGMVRSIPRLIASTLKFEHSWDECSKEDLFIVGGRVFEGEDLEYGGIATSRS
jgi:hypothetical protein